MTLNHDFSFIILDKTVEIQRFLFLYDRFGYDCFIFLVIIIVFRATILSFHPTFDELSYYSISIAKRIYY
jgi:hypothetical protein